MDIRKGTKVKETMHGIKGKHRPEYEAIAEVDEEQKENLSGFSSSFEEVDLQPSKKEKKEALSTWAKYMSEINILRVKILRYIKWCLFLAFLFLAIVLVYLALTMQPSPDPPNQWDGIIEKETDGKLFSQKLKNGLSLLIV